LAAASKSKGTICSEYYEDYSNNGNFEIEHPTGISKIKVEVDYNEKNEIKNLICSTTRHARLIMSGDVYIKKSLVE
jgi:2-methylaconitate cis-trans-isomerase PrpF